MLDRFTGSDGPRRIRQAIYEQHCVAHNDEVADALLRVLELVSYNKDDVIIKQDAHDNDVYFLMAGTVSIMVNGREMALRQAAQHVGEMALIEPSVKRSATVVALEPVVAAKVSEPNFAAIAEIHPYLWRRLAMELGDRLRERSKHVRSPNTRPHVFIGSSVEGLAVAKEIQLGLAHLNVVVHLWTNNVFIPGHGTLDDLETKIHACDIGVMIFTQDDKSVNADRGVDMLAPRDNCILELGMCLGALGRHRTLLVKPRTRDLKIPSDLVGNTPIEYTGDDPDPNNLTAHISPVCTAIEKIVKAQGPR